jgi:hypothetical protein
LGHLLKPHGATASTIWLFMTGFFPASLPQAVEAFQEGSMKRLPVLFLAAAIAIWGLAYIPDGSSSESSLQVSAIRTAAAQRHGQSAAILSDALSTRKATASSLRAALIVVGLGPE